MSYIGRGTENISNVEVLDNLTFNGSASYTLQKSSTNFVPSSANNLLISISGVVQQGNFSVSGSTITFDTTVSASDTCDWILHYGTGLITTVADGTITEAKLGSNAVTTAKINNGAITSAKLDSGLALGKIGQVVVSRTTGVVNITSTNTYVDSGITATITPSSTSSKIIVMPSLNYLIYQLNANARLGTNLRILRDSTAIETWGNSGGSLFDAGIGTYNYTSGGQPIGMVNMWSVAIEDSPSTTSAITYKLQASNALNSTQFGCQHAGKASTMTLMEVLA